MKALTLFNPWAALVAVGAKRFETRSWATSYRGPLAIHVSKTLEPEHLRLSRTPVFHIAFARAWGARLDQWPLKKQCGHVIATAQLAAIFAITPDGLVDVRSGAVRPLPDEPELCFGDYSAGRYAWQLVDARRIEPVRARGQQSIWEWKEAA